MDEFISKIITDFGLPGLALGALVYAVKFMLDRHTVEVAALMASHERTTDKIVAAVEKLADSIEAKHREGNCCEHCSD